MGYDMRWQDGPDADEVAAVALARKAFGDAVAARDAIPREHRGTIDLQTDEPVGGSAEWRAAQVHVEECMSAWNEAEKSYFRLNVWGMRRYIDFMAPIGMVHNIGEDGAPPWPEPEQFGFTWAEIDDPYESKDPRAVAFIEAQNAKLRYSPEVPGIPAWKFGSNDGWWVTPLDCLGALDAWHKAGDPIPDREPEYWMRWIAYLAEAANHGGFRVR